MNATSFLIFFHWAGPTAQIPFKNRVNIHGSVRQKKLKPVCSAARNASLPAANNVCRNEECENFPNHFSKLFSALGRLATQDIHPQILNRKPALQKPFLEASAVAYMTCRRWVLGEFGLRQQNGAATPQSTFTSLRRLLVTA
jgi:hypothetical protein